MQGCDALSEITVPDSVTELGAASFYNCRALSKAVIGNGIDKLESSDSLSVYSGGSEEYGAGMFEKCTNLTIVELGGGVTDIQKDCFANSGLASINIPDTVTNIDNGAFYECSKLKNAVIGNGVKDIGKKAFINCSSLESVTIGNSVRNIGDYGFAFVQL